MGLSRCVARDLAALDRTSDGIAESDSLVVANVDELSGPAGSLREAIGRFRLGDEAPHPRSQPARKAAPASLPSRLLPV